MKAVQEAMGEVFAPLKEVQWSSVNSWGKPSRDVLVKIAGDKPLLEALLIGTSEDENLLAQCDVSAALNKIVLWSDPAGYRLRLHIFSGNTTERVHNHRWPFSAIILRGSYEHTIYSSRSSVSELPGADALMVVTARTERVGSCYSLSEQFLHTAFASPDCVSLVLRGPALLDRSVKIEPQTNESWWHYGAQGDQTPDTKKNKPMSPEFIRQQIEALRAASILA